MKITDLDISKMPPGQQKMLENFRMWYQDYHLDFDDPEVLCFMAYLQGSEQALLDIQSQL